MNLHAHGELFPVNIAGGPRKAIGPMPAAAACLAAAVAIAIQSLWIPIDADVSWLITVSERVLSGDSLYRDVLEVNPPASVWLYLPLVWLAQLVGLKPEAVVAAGFVAAGLASVAATIGLASRLEDAPRATWLAPALAFVTLVLPMALFAQREHAALLLAFPILTGLAVIAEGKYLDRRFVYAGGIAAGLIIVLKPPFVLALVVPAAWAAWRRRTLLPLVPGIAGAAGAVALYAIAILLFARAYFDVLPTIVHTYAPMRVAAWKAVLGPVIYPATCLVLALVLRPPRVPALAAAWVLGAAGFMLSAIVQGKNYPNHWLPGAALALAGVFTVLAMPRIEPIRRAIIGIALAAVAFYEMNSWAIRPDPAVAAAIERSAPPSPSIIALSPQLTTGHPVTRNVGGHWAGSRAGLFTASGALYVGLDDVVALQAYREDIQSFATDVARHSPDVVLVDKKSKEWLMGEPVIARAMAAYRPAANTSKTEIWLRQAPEVASRGLPVSDRGLTAP